MSAVRRRVTSLYAGGTNRARAAGARDYSVRGAVRALRGAVESFALDKVPVVGSSSFKGARRKGSKEGGRGWKDRLAGAVLKGGVVLDADEIDEGMREVLELAKEAGEKGAAQGFVLLGDLYLVRLSRQRQKGEPVTHSSLFCTRAQTGHLSVPADAVKAAEAYTQASERYGSPEAQYKLGFLYSSNFGSAFGGLEGKGQQGSVRTSLLAPGSADTDTAWTRRRSCTTRSPPCRATPPPP